MDFGRYSDTVEHVQGCLNDDEWLHTIRVVNYALQILEAEPKADVQITVLSAILHDIGRAKRPGGVRKDGANHAKHGAEKAEALLREKGYDEDTVMRVSACILAHSRKSEIPPDTIEAKILFDADKLDLTGAIGLVRAVQYASKMGEPLYRIDEDGFPLHGKKKEDVSLLRDYQQSLEKLYQVFHTEKAKKLAMKHQKDMDGCFNMLYAQIDKNHEKGLKLMIKHLKNVQKQREKQAKEIEPLPEGVEAAAKA